MQITVIAITPARNGEAEEHDAPIVEADTGDGELRITRRDVDGKALGWTLYGAGQWHKAELTVPMDPEVARQRAMLNERDRNNGGRGFATPAGNSGPQ